MLSLFCIIYQTFASNCSTYDNGLNLYVFYTQICPFCKKYDLTVQSLMNNIGSHNIPIKIKKIDCKVCDCSSEGITGYPTTILKEDMSELGRISGAQSCKSVTEFLDQNLCIKNGNYTSIKHCKSLYNPKLDVEWIR